MASTRKRPPATDASAARVIASVEAVIADRVRPGQHVCVALSGGVDSVVLLDCLARLRRRRRFRLSAIHVNHGLSPNAGRWAGFCKRICARRRVPITVHEAHVSRMAGESLEAKAREARYRALQAQRADFVALAHSLDDQAETVLLQMLRGAGLKGLAGMPVVREAAARSSPTAAEAKLLRPLLAVPRADIEAWARALGLSWVEDESNASLRFDRNYLRRRVIPLLERRFPGYRETLARTSRHMAEALALAKEVSDLDSARALETDGIRVPVLRELGPGRAKNLLRHVLEARGAPMPPEASLEEGLRQLLAAGADARVRVALGALVLRRQGSLAYLEPALPDPPPGLEVPWRGERELDLGPGVGRLRFRRIRGRGLSLERLGTEGIAVRLRRGGERLRPDPRRPRRTLKNLLQECGMPHWRRERLPLLFRGDYLVWAAGIGADGDFRCGAGEPGVEISWDAEG
jgi:tRNA(Ile)-lysidine synthase